MRRLAPGFTLIELMIALAITGILASIAWPGYLATVHRSQRVEARLALLRIQYLQERHYSRYHRYSTDLTASVESEGLGTVAHSDPGNYALDLVTSEDGERYVATALATSSGRQAGDNNCRMLSIDETGRRRSAPASGVWSDTDELRCWGA